MARYRTSIDSGLDPAEAFARIAAFERAAEWDGPSRSAERSATTVPARCPLPDRSRFAGRDIELV